jgi:hypothetical protein
MDPEGSLPRLQGQTTGPYPDPDHTSPKLPNVLSKIHFNIIIPSTPKSSTWYRPFKSSN